MLNVLMFLVINFENIRYGLYIYLLEKINIKELHLLGHIAQTIHFIHKIIMVQTFYTIFVNFIQTFKTKSHLCCK